MNAPQLADDTVQVTLLAASGPSALAAQTLSRHFGLSVQRAESVLSQGRGVIAANMAHAAARAALPLLAALGLQVAIQATGTEPEAERHDLSIRLTHGFQAARLIRTLHRLMGPGNLTAHWFDGPSGMVLEGLTSAKVDWISAAVRPISGALVAVSAQRTALYDLFGTLETSKNDLIRLRRHLTHLGCRAGRFGDALASGLDRRARDHVLTRFGQAGLFGINQDFERFDLLVSGNGSLSAREFADFLITRTGCAPGVVRKISPSAPLRIESCLTRAATRQFLGDYAAIGIPAFARLIRT